MLSCGGGDRLVFDGWALSSESASAEVARSVESIGIAWIAKLSASTHSVP